MLPSTSAHSPPEKSLPVQQIKFLLGFGILASLPESLAQQNATNEPSTTLNTTGSPQRLSGPKRAVAVLCGGPNSTVNGTVIFDQAGQGAHLHISGCISGLEPNSTHGFHIHMFGDTRKGCVSTGSHFNPSNATHGGPHDSVRHAGDLGNVRADENGEVKIDIVDSVLSIGGPNCIIGRSVVLHEKEDDLGQGGTTDSLSTGNAGGRLACGVIGIANPS